MSPIRAVVTWIVLLAAGWLVLIGALELALRLIYGG